MPVGDRPVRCAAAGWPLPRKVTARGRRSRQGACQRCRSSEGLSRHPPHGRLMQIRQFCTGEAMRDVPHRMHERAFPHMAALHGSADEHTCRITSLGRPRPATGWAHRRPDAEDELAHGAVGTDLPLRAARPHPHLEPATLGPHTSRVRAVLQPHRPTRQWRTPGHYAHLPPPLTDPTQIPVSTSADINTWAGILNEYQDAA
jgi:hypothetical protein